MPNDYVFGSKDYRDKLARDIDQDLAFNTRGPIRPVRERDLGNKSDLEIARSALGGRHTVEYQAPLNRPPSNPEQVPPDTVRRSTIPKYRPKTFRPMKRETVMRKGGR